MYPDDALTLQKEIVGVGNYTFLSSGTYTILGIDIHHSTANNPTSDSTISCGSTVIAHTFGGSDFANSLSYICNSTVTLAKTGNDTVFASVTYVPRDISATLSPDTLDLHSGFSDSFTLVFLYLGILIFGLGTFIGTNIFRR